VVILMETTATWCWEAIVIIIIITTSFLLCVWYTSPFWLICSVCWCTFCCDTNSFVMNCDLFTGCVTIQARPEPCWERLFHLVAHYVVWLRFT
jgi:hypothetical protein